MILIWLTIGKQFPLQCHTHIYAHCKSKRVGSTVWIAVLLCLCLCDLSSCFFLFYPAKGLVGRCPSNVSTRSNNFIRFFEVTHLVQTTASFLSASVFLTLPLTSGVGGKEAEGTSEAKRLWHWRRWTFRASHLQCSFQSSIPYFILKVSSIFFSKR